MCTRFELSNGLKGLAIQHSQAPVVAIQGWIRFGSADEGEEQAGLAHLFEHLLFKGTQRRPVGAIAREVESLGGDLNAYTTYDHTVMHMTLASKHLGQGLDILSDSLMNSVVSEEELVRERVVVLEEIKRRNDMPGATASDLLRDKLFMGHPYARPVIGYSNVVERMSRVDIMDAYKKFYNSKNIFLVVSGDFEPKNLEELCEKYFAGLRPGPGPAERGVLTPLKGYQSNFKNHPSPDSILNLGWRGPSGVGFEAAVLDAWALILGQGESSRLTRKIIYDEKLLRDIGAGFWGPKEAGSFQIGMRGPAGTSLRFEKIVQSVRECFDAEITDNELNKAKKNLLASAIYSKETVDGIAQRFAYFESIADDFEEDGRYLESVRNLRKEDIVAVRDKYLNWNEVIAAGIVPEKDLFPNYSPPLAPKAKKKESARPTQVKDYGVETFEHNGLKVLVKTVKEPSIFSLRWVGLGGSRMEPADQGGLGTLWARCATSGGTTLAGKKYSREDMNEAIDLMSASVSAFHGKNSHGFQLDGLTEDFEDLFELMLAAKFNPLFDSAHVDQEKAHQLIDIESSTNNPSTVASRLFASTIFGKHPYGRNSLGEKLSVKKLSAKHLKAYHAKLEKQPQVLSIVGNLRKEEVQNLLKKYLPKHKFVRNSSKIKRLPLSFPKVTSVTRKELKKEQSHLLMGFPTCTLFDKDRWALMGLSAVLGGQGGRLFMELRDKMSLCYTVAPSHMEGLDGGYFAFYIATSPQNEEIALNALGVEIQKIVREGVSKEEWEKARTFFVGNFEIEQQRFSSQALGMALDELYGLGFKEYFHFEKRFDAVKPSDLQKVAKKYLAKKNGIRVTSVVGPAVAATAEAKQ